MAPQENDPRSAAWQFLAPEYKVDLQSGQLISNDDQRVANTMCLGCWTKCGVRARIDQNR